jgi:hypothetical protein
VFYSCLVGKRYGFTPCRFDERLEQAHCALRLNGTRTPTTPEATRDVQTDTGRRCRGDGYVFWNGYFIGHLVQPRGWTLLPTGGVITWHTDHTTVFQIGGSEAEMTYTGTLDALPEGVFRFVTCWIDYSATRYSQQPVWGGNLIVDLDVR